MTNNNSKSKNNNNNNNNNNNSSSSSNNNNNNNNNNNKAMSKEPINKVTINTRSARSLKISNLHLGQEQQGGHDQEQQDGQDQEQQGLSWICRSMQIK